MKSRVAPVPIGTVRVTIGWPKVRFSQVAAATPAISG
jgi:hypothetical protein